MANTTGAIAASGLQIDVGLSTNGTAVSLATADAATTKAFRRTYLGSLSWPASAAVGTGQSLNLSFQTPFVINPGDFCNVTWRIPFGTLTGITLTGGVALEGYFE